MTSKRIVYLNKSSSDRKSINLQKSKIIYTSPYELERKFERFDFSDEWNNLGYGRITGDDSEFSLSDFTLSSDGFDKVLGKFLLSDGTEGVYAGVKQNELIFNRQVGPIDGVDYFLIEEFLQEESPVLLDIPYGYKSAVTMRIDCDEAISSGKALAELYAKHSVPFSMAIKTSLDLDKEACSTIGEVLNNGGSILSHSHTHAPNWGGSREKATWEAQTARERLTEVLPTGYNMDFVVSPFHQNPRYAVEGLQAAGIKGFVGGIIKNDPEYLVARASWAKDVPDIMTHSQQCMLHGDCYHKAGNSLEIYKESFKNHFHTNTFFGFLDHPFSNYLYGWKSEEERLAVHDEFLTYLKSHKGIWFSNLVDAMSFLWIKVNTEIWEEEGKLRWRVPKHSYENLPDLCVWWKGLRHRVPING